MKGTLAASAAVAAILATSCSSTPPPTERMATAKASVHAARTLGAESIPRAQLHLRLAEEELNRASRLIADDENERADLMLQRASADAQVALALTREASMRESLGEEVVP